MDKKVDEQLRQVKESIRRAKAHPDKTGTFRRETFRRLIDLTHSNHPSLKILAAGNIQYFVAYFPELEEAAINAVYDLCEDQDSEVRKAGYSAVAQVSRERMKWVKRNADVLVQLLQSDEPDEVILVKKALVDHLDMDPSVTIGVLCDQILPPEEAVGDEDLAVRDRLRALVLSFITREARQAIVERDAAQKDGSSVQEMLIQALWAVAPKLNNADVEFIVKDILVSLPLFREPNSTRGNELLKSIIEEARSSFRNDFRPGNSASFAPTRLYINLAKHIVLNEELALPTELLQFFCSSMIGKMTLQKFSAEDRVLVISDTAEMLTVCYEDVRCRDWKEFLSSQRQIVDACPILLEGLLNPGMSQIGSWKACKQLLQACLRRKAEQQWNVPANLVNLLHKIQEIPAVQDKEQDYHEVQALIRPLAQPNPKEMTAAQTAPVNVSTGLAGSSESQQLVKPSDHESPNATAKLPSAMSSTASPLAEGASAEPASMIMGAHSTASVATTATTATSTVASKRPTIAEDRSRAPKKMKQAVDVAPSLLSRMGTSVTDREGFTQGISMGRQDANNDASFHRLDINEPEVSAGGYSIRGAAKAERMADSTPESTTWSLLDRIKDQSVGDNTNGKRRRKRSGGGGRVQHRFR